MSAWAACTIAAKARLPSARVVAASFAEHHPGVPFFVLLADEPDGCFDPVAEPCELIGLDALDLPDLRTRAFRYEREQLSYALTPTLLRHLLRRGFERVLFIKQESLVALEADRLSHWRFRARTRYLDLRSAWSIVVRRTSCNSFLPPTSLPRRLKRAEVVGPVTVGWVD